MIVLITRQIFQLHYISYFYYHCWAKYFCHWGFLSMASIIKQINLRNMLVKQLVTQEAEFAPSLTDDPELNCHEHIHLLNDKQVFTLFAIHYQTFLYSISGIPYVLSNVFTKFVLLNVFTKNYIFLYLSLRLNR